MSKYKTIQKLCKERGTSVAQMERELGFARGSIAKIDDHQPSIGRVTKICDYLMISPMQLFADEDATEADHERMKEYVSAINEMYPEDTVHTDEQVYEVAAGQGRINDGAERFEPINGRIAKVVGDSMLPTLRNGDYVNIVETTDVSPSDYAVVRINGDELTIKHVEITKDGMWVRAENKDVYEDRFYSISDIVLLPVQVVGKATQIIQRKL